MEAFNTEYLLLLEICSVSGEQDERYFLKLAEVIQVTIFRSTQSHDPIEHINIIAHTGSHLQHCKLQTFPMVLTDRGEFNLAFSDSALHHRSVWKEPLMIWSRHTQGSSPHCHEFCLMLTFGMQRFICMHPLLILGSNLKDQSVTDQSQRHTNISLDTLHPQRLPSVPALVTSLDCVKFNMSTLKPKFKHLVCSVLACEAIIPAQRALICMNQREIRNPANDDHWINWTSS